MENTLKSYSRGRLYSEKIMRDFIFLIETKEQIPDTYIFIEFSLD